jgi:XTP/dITP diphosphohydrolase
VADAVADLVAVMDRLRRECAWTRQQTHESLRPYVLEEAHEVADAIDSADSAHLVDELGDLLMQVVFHASIAAESRGWDLQDVARAITEKLIRRNPHVFAPTAGANALTMTAAEVEAQWQRIKQSERRAPDASGPGGAPAPNDP